MLHVLPLPSEHSPTAASGPWPGLRGRRPRNLRREKGSPRRKLVSHKTETDGSNSQEGDDETAKSPSVRQRSISECYFAVKGAALVLPQNECINYRKCSASGGGDIQQHLQSMFYLLRQEDTLKMAVKLESIHVGRTRYLVVVSCTGKQSTEENCLLGVDCNEQVTIGLVLPVWADTVITLDGDGGFRVSSIQRNHIFKPVSVQAMWSALQTLHKASAKARENNYFMGGLTHSWIDYYEKKIASDRSCLNEWHLMDNLETRRPPSPDCCRSRPKERELTEQDIRGKLKEIMMTVDLDEVTSKYIRSRLEEVLDMDLQEYKSFIDQEMITILGQMDKATEIFDHLYLGSEWNASNLEELQKNGVGHILNVTREIDNFFPGMFDYLNIRVYDDEATELLRHWDTTYKFITNARDQGSKVLVHCKMGVSRSASVVIAYAMKAHNWNMQKAHKFVKNRRTCIKPNTGFMRQLEIYQGILCASKHRHNTLWRSKSENNLKIQPEERQDLSAASSQLEEPQKPECAYLETPSHWLTPGHRPKSWSPDDNTADMLFPAAETPDEATLSKETAPDALTSPAAAPTVKSKNHVLLTCRDAKTYSVSPNKALHLDMPLSQPADPAGAVKFQIGDDESPVYECRNPIFADSATPDEEGAEILNQIGPVPRVSSIKDRINELESHAQLSELRLGPNRERLDLPENTGLVLNLTNQFESVSKSNPASPVDENGPEMIADILGNEPVVSQTKPPVPRHQAVLVRPGTWEEKPPDIGTTPEVAAVPGAKLDELIMRLRVNSQMKEIAAGCCGSDEGIAGDSPLRSTIAASRFAFFGGEDGPAAAPGGRSPPTRLADPFSTHVDHVFEREERSQHSGGKARDGVPARHDSWGSCDSAIGLHMPSQRESPSRQSSWGSVESRGVVLSRETSWGSADAAKRPQTLPEGGQNLFIVDQEPAPWATGTVKRNKKASSTEDGTLKRTSSLDGALPLHDTAAIPGAGATPSGAAAEFSLCSLIQRSQSLRTSTSSKRGAPCKNASGSPPTTFAPKLRLHGPKPYSSPPEKHVHLVMDNKPWLNASTAPDGGTPHYASTPILYKSIKESVAAGPLHSASQPNITYSQPVQQHQQHYSKSRSGLQLDLGGVAYQPPEQAPEEVPCPGIVRQQKEVIENIIAAQPSTSTLEQSPPAPPERKPCSAEELKRVQQKMQLLDCLPKMATPPAVEADDGVVKRITRVIEAKGVVVVAGAPTVPAEGRSQNCDKMIILDQNGKELAAQAAMLLDDADAECAQLAVIIAAEEKSVKSLVGKFEVKEQPTRQRYFSETEVTSTSTVPATPPQTNGATAARAATQLHHCCSLDSDKSRPFSESRNTAASPCDKNAKVVAGTDAGFKGFSGILSGVGMPRSRPPPAAKAPPDNGAPGTTTSANSAQRKVRKAQGKTHPLSKLQTKHRHLNTFYNTV